MFIYCCFTVVYTVVAYVQLSFGLILLILSIVSGVLVDGVNHSVLNNGVMFGS